MIAEEILPAKGGVYALVMRLSEPCSLTVGKLGRFALTEGEYIYVGSALGPGGLRARLSRYQKERRRLHWHIDYLLTVATLEGAFYLITEQRLECRWVQAFSALPGARLPLPGFGASDCGALGSHCLAHLIAFPQGLALEEAWHALAQASAVDCKEIHLI